MDFSVNYITVIGLTAQALFSARLIVQWFKSQKAGKVLSPVLFWQLSIIASYLLFSYGVLRNDFSIILGQIISYFIYIRNLQLKGNWKEIPYLFRLLCVITPFFAIAYGLFYFEDNIVSLFNNPNIPMKILVWGSLGQVIFTLRFIYQWLYSEKLNNSVLPLGFWIISLTGSLMIVSYGLYLGDIVLILGQGFGIIIYSWNSYTIFKNKRFEASS